MPTAIAPTPARKPIAITSDDVKNYHENGFMVLDCALEMDEVDLLRRETTRICRGELGIFGGLAEPTGGESDDEVLKRTLCVHFPHKISPVMLQYLAPESGIKALTAVIGPNIKCMQSMLFIKAAGKPGQAWHQDEYYIPTRDRSLTGMWMALDDATVDNGCLWTIPGSHKPGVLWPQRQHGKQGVFDCAGEAWRFPYGDEDAVPVEVKAGSIVLFNGYLLHRSLPNRATSGFRRVLVNHYMSAESLLPWHKPEEGVGMGNADYRDILLVAGEDPYAWKGTIDQSRPHVRPSGEGGCGNAVRNLDGGKPAS